MLVRQAKMEDSNGIAKVHVDSWKTTYTDILPETFLNNLSYDKRKQLWQNNITNNGENIFVIETDTGQIVGFADCGKRK
ncbi:hypothetical protein [Mangrovibacillus cuniculi]|uniref:hypothetical protein n=1 Tax=Mangrovibacillus cuniculi TaxID=2593652 RepID=UPI001EFA1967|nr:hypothetical protein [Mangrovibacillus cuniculi]